MKNYIRLHNQPEYTPSWSSAKSWNLEQILSLLSLQKVLKLPLSCCLLIACLLFADHDNAFSQPQSSSRNSNSMQSKMQPLHPGDHKNTVQLSPGQTHTWPGLIVPENQYVRITVEQQGIGVRLETLNSNGKLLFSIEQLNATHGPLTGVLVADGSSGPYILRVTGLYADGKPGGYYLQISQAQRVDDQIDKEAQSQQLVQEAMQLTDHPKDVDQVEQAYRRLIVARELVNSYDTKLQYAQIQLRIGDVCDTMDQYLGVNFYMQEAMLYYSEAAKVFQQANQSYDQAVALAYLGWDTFASGDKLTALNLYDEAKYTYQRCGALRDLGTCLNDMGLIYQSLQEPDLAMSYYHQALALSLKCAHSTSAGTTYNNIGLVLMAAPNITEYLDSLRQGEAHKDLKLIKQAHENLTKANAEILRNLHQAELLRTSDSARAQTFNNLAAAYMLTNNFSKALDYLKRAQALAADRNVQEWMVDEINIAGLRGSQGNHKEEEERLRNLLKKLSGLTSNPGLETVVRLNLAKLMSGQNQLAESQSQLEKVLQLAEGARNVAGDSESTIKYFASKVDMYDLLIDVLMLRSQKEHNPTLAHRALEISELTKARRLKDILQSNRSIVVDPIMSKKLNALNKDIVTIAETIRGRQQSAPVNGIPSDIYLRLLLEQQERQAASMNSATTVSDPVIAADSSVTELLKNAMLDDETVIVEYNLGEDHSYAWAISQTGTIGFPLGDTSAINQAAGRLLSLYVTPVPADKKDSTFLKILHEEEDKLAKLILKPLEPQLSKKRIVFIPDGVLNAVPFAALPDPSKRIIASLPGETIPRLIYYHDISYVPSLSVLSILRKRSEPWHIPWANNLIISDPIYCRDDPRLDDVHAIGKEIVGNTTPNELGRLPWTRNERLSFETLNPGGSLSSLFAQDVTKAKVLERGLEHFDLIHLATHSIFDDAFPEISHIAFGKYGVNGIEKDQNLYAFEILQMHLPAQLLVLSSCETAYGSSIRGEGALSITRACMAAGTQRIVASLWTVPGEATAELMDHFYYALFQDHLSPAASLSQAQRQLADNPRWNSPYYWAAFIIQGDWR